LSVVWLNGKFMNGDAALDPADRGFLLGDGVFETVAVQRARAIWLPEHIARMESAARELGIPFHREEVLSGVAQVLEKSTDHGEILRITMSRGAAGRGLAGNGTSPTLLITLAEFSYATVPQACRVKISTIRRNEHAPSSRLKTLSYIDGIMAAREVAGDADEALMLNTAGHVASATIGNVFLLKDNTLITPGLDQGILAGITRQKIIEVNVFATVQRPVNWQELGEADAVFLCNSLRCLRPIGHLNGIELNQQPLEELYGEITRLMLKGQDR
jgi:branched-chain amino acid aminotransferase